MHQASQLAADEPNLMGKRQIIPWYNLTSGLADSTTFPFSKNRMQQRFWLRVYDHHWKITSHNMT
jgi:hypothetical protein